MAILEILAQTTTTTSPATSPAGNPAPFWANQWFPLILMAVVFYFFVIRAKKTQDRKKQQMLDNLKRGDRIQTIGGILGTVVELRENNTEVVVKVDENTNTKIRFSRGAIHRVISEEESGGGASSSENK